MTTACHLQHLARRSPLSFPLALLLLLSAAGLALVGVEVGASGSSGGTESGRGGQRGGGSHNRAGPGERTKEPRGGFGNSQKKPAATGGGEALVVCAVDGTVYTLDAWTGNLRGLFASGGPLVSSSAVDVGGAGSGEWDDDDEGGWNDDDASGGSYEADGEDACLANSGRAMPWWHRSRSSRSLDSSDGDAGEGVGFTPWERSFRRRRDRRGTNRGGSWQRRGAESVTQPQIVPGLDGNLYALSYPAEGAGGVRGEGVKLDVLPVTAMDVADNPVSTCPSDSGRGQSDSFSDEGGDSDYFSEFGLGDDQHDNDEGEDDGSHSCGIVTAQKSTVIYALDPSTGTVRWVQDPRGNSAVGGVSFTASQATSNPTFKVPRDRNRKQGGKSKPPVLLQREDYAVRQVDVRTGEEMWNVTVGHFSALDFGGGGGGDDDGWVNGGGGMLGSSNGRRRSTNAAAAKFASAREGGPLALPHRASPSRRSECAGQSHPHHSQIHEERHPNQGGQGAGGGKEKGGFFAFPSIAFGEDGTSITAVDSSTGGLLWKKSVESVVAAVYGIGRQSSWVSLEVVDERDVLRNGNDAVAKAAMLSLEDVTVATATHSGGIGAPFLPSGGWFLPSPSLTGVHSAGLTSSSPPPPSSSSSLVPYDNSKALVQRDLALSGLSVRSSTFESARLGRHSTTLFVASTTSQPMRHQGHSDPIFRGHDSRYPLLESDDSFVRIPESDGPDPFNLGGKSGAAILGDINQTPLSSPLPPTHTTTHKTEHGLFLTWQMVSVLTLMLLMSVAGLRIGYLHQKRKWESQRTPPLVPTNPNSREEGEFLTCGSPGDGSNSRSRRSLPDNLSLNNDAAPVLSAFTPPPLSLNPSLHNQNSIVNIVKKPPALVKSRLIRSTSLPHLNALLGGGGAAELVRAKNRESVAQGITARRNGLRETAEDKPAIPLVRVATTGTATGSHMNATRKARSRSDPEQPTEAPSDSDGVAKSHVGGVDSVDGIPLVRYSRYTSEFTEISPLGKGGFGTVFRCSNALDGREYAVKKIWIKSYAEGAGVAEHFAQKLHRVLREVKILALLDHPNIVRYYTAWLELEEARDDSIDEEGSVSLTTLGGHGGVARCFSSELLTGAGASASATPETFSRNWRSHGLSNATRPFSPKSKRKTLASQRSSRTSRGESSKSSNPLGWNNFLTGSGWYGANGPLFDSQSEDDFSRGSSIMRRESLRQSASSIEEEDLGFNWERSSSGARLDCGHDSSADGLSVINDTDHSDSANDNSDSKNSSASSMNSSTSSSDSNSSDGASDVSESSSSTSEAGPKGAVAISESVKSSSIQSRIKSYVKEKFSGTGKASSGEPSSPTSMALSPTKSKPMEPLKIQRHILYIQMQLCSQKTLADFLADARARRGTHRSSVNCSDNKDQNSVDIPHALRLFSQIVRGVKHVHKQGLIHRDLKPSNCFIDDSGVVKIGDFGLSRESATTGVIGKSPEEDAGGSNEDEDVAANGKFEDGSPRNFLGGDDNTAGVGTRSYASPEQMSGSDYGASTDVYSLGIMLFELCYPMYTGMERHMVFNGIRRRTFPAQWSSTVASSFPSLHQLLLVMLSPMRTERPSAAAVASHIDTVLGEYTVLSLDRTRQQEGSLLLRVEADDAEGVLHRTIKTIKQAASNIVVLQYGLRGQGSKAIMEFALSITNGGDKLSEEEDKNEDGQLVTDKADAAAAPPCIDDAVQQVFASLNKSEEIKVVRQVTEKHLVLGRGGSLDTSNHGAS